MCDPVSITTAVVAVVGTAYSVDQQRQAANRQERAYKAQQKVQEEQIADQKGVEMQRRQQAARAERARLRAASAESGLAGLTFDDLITNVSFQEGQDVALIERNLSNARDASTAEMNSRLSQIQQPDYAGAIADSTLRVYGIYQNAQPSTPPSGG